MAATNKTPGPAYLTARQGAALNIALAIVTSAGYEIVDSGDGEVAANIAHRSVEILDAVLKASA
jgi:hypothetical protein